MVANEDVAEIFTARLVLPLISIFHTGRFGERRHACVQGKMTTKLHSRSVMFL